MWFSNFAYTYYLLVLLEFVHLFIKFAQMKYVFVCDLMASIIVCQGDIYNTLFIKLTSSLQTTFWVFKISFKLKHDETLVDIPNMNSISSFLIENLFIVETLPNNLCRSKTLKLSPFFPSLLDFHVHASPWFICRLAGGR